MIFQLIYASVKYQSSSHYDDLFCLIIAIDIIVVLEDVFTFCKGCVVKYRFILYLIFVS